MPMRARRGLALAWLDRLREYAAADFDRFGLRLEATRLRGLPRCRDAGSVALLREALASVDRSAIQRSGAICFFSLSARVRDFMSDFGRDPARLLFLQALALSLAAQYLGGSAEDEANQQVSEALAALVPVES